MVTNDCSETVELEKMVSFLRRVMGPGKFPLVRQYFHYDSAVVEVWLDRMEIKLD